MSEGGSWRATTKTKTPHSDVGKYKKNRVKNRKQ